jgi:3-deoxy-D-arabino-heptulosonate 7-phosphate (DAHP) synthase
MIGLICIMKKGHIILRKCSKGLNYDSKKLRQIAHFISKKSQIQVRMSQIVYISLMNGHMFHRLLLTTSIIDFRIIFIRQRRF